MTSEREMRKFMILSASEAIRQGIVSMIMEAKVHDDFLAQSEDFKNGFEMALSMVHDTIGDVMRDVAAM